MSHKPTSLLSGLEYLNLNIELEECCNHIVSVKNHGLKI